MKKIFTIAIIALSMNVFAQVPTNGLVGYWPFNGNANDESGNNNNGTVSGATLTTDRFGNANKAYSFDGTNDYISVLDNNSLDLTNQLTLSAWFFTDGSKVNQGLLGKGGLNNAHTGYALLLQVSNPATSGVVLQNLPTTTAKEAYSPTNIANNWHNFTGTYNGTTLKLYIDGVLTVSSNVTISLSNSTSNLFFGQELSGFRYFKGILDDIRIYNRALTQQEISAIYTECDLSVQITPTDNSVPSNANAQFVASSVEPTSTYQWQTNFDNVGWQDAPVNSKYSGSTTTTLNVNNVQLSNHLQPFRVIATAGTCRDTSATARIVISDTCILTVTDTLVINATLTGLQSPNNKNTIKVYPNPANDHITIDYGNYANMSGYTLKITNTLGATVFTTTINQQTSYVDLNGWGGNGIYFVHLIDAQSQTLDIRKIVIQ